MTKFNEKMFAGFCLLEILRKKKLNQLINFYIFILIFYYESKNQNKCTKIETIFYFISLN